MISWLCFAQGTPSLEELKLMYYRLLIRYHEHNNSYIDICRCYRSIYEVGSRLCLLLKTCMCALRMWVAHVAVLRTVNTRDVKRREGSSISV